MIPYENLEAEWQKLKDAGSPPKLLHLSSDRFEDLLGLGEVKRFEDGHYYYRRVTMLIVWPKDYLEFEVELLPDEQLKALRDGMVDFDEACNGD